jgi:hypothetical protein
MTRIEDQLRALYHADAELIQPEGLRPPATFARPPARRIRRLPASATVLAVAAVMVATLVIPRLLLGTAPSSPGHPATGATRSALTVTFATHVTIVSPPGVPVTVPVAEVHAADPQAARRVSSVIGANLADIISAFRNRASENIALGSSPRHMYERITVADMTTWHHYLSIRLDSFSDTGDQDPINESTALTFDTTTGARILPTAMFTSITKATSVVRAALLASRTDGSLNGYDLSTLSLQPSEAGSTTPLNCYPAPAGLHCLVDQGSLAPYAAGRIEAIIPWQRLAALLRPGFAT